MHIKIIFRNLALAFCITGAIVTPSVFAAETTLGGEKATHKSYGTFIQNIANTTRQTLNQSLEKGFIHSSDQRPLENLFKQMAYATIFGVETNVHESNKSAWNATFSFVKTGNFTFDAPGKKTGISDARIQNILKVCESIAVYIKETQGDATGKPTSRICNIFKIDNLPSEKPLTPAEAEKSSLQKMMLMRITLGYYQKMDSTFDPNDGKDIWAFLLGTTDTDSLIKKTNAAVETFYGYIKKQPKWELPEEQEPAKPISVQQNTPTIVQPPAPTIDTLDVPKETQPKAKTVYIIDGVKLDLGQLEKDLNAADYWGKKEIFINAIEKIPAINTWLEITKTNRYSGKDSIYLNDKDIQTLAEANIEGLSEFATMYLKVENSKKPDYTPPAPKYDTTLSLNGIYAYDIANAFNLDRIEDCIDLKILLEDKVGVYEKYKNPNTSAYDKNEILKHDIFWALSEGNAKFGPYGQKISSRVFDALGLSESRIKHMNKETIKKSFTEKVKQFPINYLIRIIKEYNSLDLWSALNERAQNEPATELYLRLNGIKTADLLDVEKLFSGGK